MTALAHDVHRPALEPVRLSRAIVAGVIATAVLTTLWIVESSLGLPSIAVGQILGSAMSVSVARLRVGVAGGWLMHFVVGVVFALFYAWRLAQRLPGPPAVAGALYGAMLFVLAQLLFMPLVGAGVFSRGDAALLLGSLLGHLAYGAVLGWIYALPPQEHHRPSSRETS